MPFYAALPYSTIDWTLDEAGAQIPIEERSAREVTHIAGLDEQGQRIELRIAAPGVDAANPAFDVTPARLLTGLITERGVTAASRAGLAALYPDERAARSAG